MVLNQYKERGSEVSSEEWLQLADRRARVGAAVVTITEMKSSDDPDDSTEPKYSDFLSYELKLISLCGYIPIHLQKPNPFHLTNPCLLKKLIPQIYL